MSLECELERELKSNARLEQIEELLQAGANVNYCGDSEYDESVNFIGLAIHIHRVDIVESLVRAGAKINPTAKALSDSALDIAASEGCQESFDFLAPLTKPSIARRLSTASLPHGIKFRAYNEKWSYDFRSASVNAHLQLVRSHIEQGLDIDIVGSNGATLLWTAAHNGHLSSIRILLESGASANFKNRTDGFTALMIAAGTHQAWLDGTRPYWGEARSYQVEVVRLLIKNGAEVNATAHDGRTALMEAVGSGSVEMIIELLEAGSDIKMRDSSGRNVLFYIPESGYTAQKEKTKVDIAHLLITSGAEINTRSDDGRTSLMEISDSPSSPDIIKALLDAGSDINAQDYFGYTALDYARKRSAYGIVRTLQQANQQ